jgi:CheY-like chemotaxis protein
MARIAYIAQHRRGLPELLKQLSETGYTVYRLDPNMMAYRQLRDDPPDMILADMTLRSAHVKELLDALSKSPITRAVALSVLGVAPEEQAAAKAKAPMAREFHTGPVTRKLLIDIVKRHLASEA